MRGEQEYLAETPVNTDQRHSGDWTDRVEGALSVLAAPTPRQRAVASVIVLLILAALMWLDWVTQVNLNLSVTYFVPITLAAWLTARRSLPILIAALATVPYTSDQVGLAEAGRQSMTIAAIDSAVVFATFVFAAEATYRLHRRYTETAGLVQQLHARNEEIGKAYRLLEEDLGAAGIVQAAMTHAPKLDVAGLDIGTRIEYARPVGGDLAIVGLVDGRVYGCIADISGKGTPAALFTTLVQHLLDDALDLGMRGADVIEYINASLLQSLPPDRFVTLLYVEIDPGSGSFEYVNAGHPAGLVYRSATDAIEELGPTNAILGISENVPVQTASGRLGPGDVLLLYTDGATDCETPEGKRLGDELIKSLLRKHAALGAQAIADAVVQEIEAISAPESRDDLSIVCMKA